LNRIRSGFTLIELLVVIAIIAILAAILFPVFAQAKAAAKKAASLSNIKQQGTGIILYTGDTDDILPLAVMQDATPNPLTYDVTWVKFTQPYIKNLSLFVDPGGVVALSNNDKTPTDKPADSGPLGNRGGPRAQGGPVVSYGMIPRGYWVGFDGSCGQGSTNCYYQNEYDGKTAKYDGVAGAAADNNSNDRCYASTSRGYPEGSLSTSQIARPSDQVMLMQSAYWDNGGCYGFIGYPRPRFNTQKAPGFFKDGVLFGQIILAATDTSARAIATQRLYEIEGTGDQAVYKRFYPHQ
jgi:prepilin-type N-terminal cleavage/methylation domain-containing protein